MFKNPHVFVSVNNFAKTKFSATCKNASQCTNANHWENVRFTTQIYFIVFSIYPFVLIICQFGVYMTC